MDADGAGLRMSPRQQLEADGYYVARRVLAPGDVDRLRRTLVGYMTANARTERLGYFDRAAAATVPDICWLFSHPKLLALVRELVGEERIVFCGCDTHLDTVSKWHRDDGDGNASYFQGDQYARDDCRVYRAVLYLQNHAENDRALKVKPGSHRRREAQGLPVEQTRPGIGDVVFFDCRTEHAGIIPDPVERPLQGIGRRMGWPRWTTRASRLYWRLAGKPHRAAIFFGYGPVNAATEDFCRAEIRWRRDWAGASRFRFSDEAAARLAGAGVLLYETELVRRLGDMVLGEFAALGKLPEERLWS